MCSTGFQTEFLNLFNYLSSFKCTIFILTIDIISKFIKVCLVGLDRIKIIQSLAVPTSYVSTEKNWG